MRENKSKLLFDLTLRNSIKYLDITIESNIPPVFLKATK